MQLFVEKSRGTNILNVHVLYGGGTPPPQKKKKSLPFDLLLNSWKPKYNGEHQLELAKG